MIPRPGRFLVVALVGAAVQLGVVWTLVHVAGVPATPATTIAVVTAVAHNFQWHRRWTWRDRPARGVAALAAFARFALTNGLVSVAGNTALSIALVEIGTVDVLTANVVAIAVCGIVNYSLANGIVFPRARSGAGSEKRARDRDGPDRCLRFSSTGREGAYR